MIKLLFRECLGRFLFFCSSSKSTTFFVSKVWVPQVVLEIGWFATNFPTCLVSVSSPATMITSWPSSSWSAIIGLIGDTTGGKCRLINIISTSRFSKHHLLPHCFSSYFRTYLTNTRYWLHPKVPPPNFIQVFVYTYQKVKNPLFFHKFLKVTDAIWTCPSKIFKCVHLLPVIGQYIEVLCYIEISLF